MAKTRSVHTIQKENYEQDDRRRSTHGESSQQGERRRPIVYALI